MFNSQTFKRSTNPDPDNFTVTMATTADAQIPAQIAGIFSRLYSCHGDVSPVL